MSSEATIPLVQLASSAWLEHVPRLVAPDEANRGLTEIIERFHIIRDAIAILGRLEIDSQRLAGLEALALTAERHCQRLQHDVAAGAEVGTDLVNVEAEATEIERGLITLDERVPFVAFRGLLGTEEVAPITMLHYARLLARYFRTGSRLGERISFLVHRLISV